jgi:uncharacterized protein (DUF169 family)
MFMIETRYLDRAEIPSIPTLDKAPAVIAYGPAGSAAFAGDVVIAAVVPAQATLLYEAALKAGVAQGAPAAFSRPACALVPVTANGNTLAVSFGCRGSRTFAGLPDEEMYVALPAARWGEITDRLLEVQRSNLTMANFYQAQRARLGKG